MRTTDYTVDDTVQGTNAGTYPVAIRGTGNYTGVRYVNFIINQKELTVATVDAPTFTYGSVPATLTENDHYTVSGFESNDASEVTVTVTAGNLNAGRYQLTPTLSDVDPNNEVAKNYTVTGTVDITVEAISVLPDPDDPTTDPNPDPDRDPDGDGVVDPDEDEDNDGFIEDTNGDGTIETTTGFTATMDPVTGVFNALPHTPDITVTYQPEGEPLVTLDQGTDYTVTYQGNTTNWQMVQVGSYTVRVELTGNYEGGFDFTYTITPGSGGEGGDGDSDQDGNIEDGNGDHVIDFGGFRVTLVPYSGIYNGQAHNPRVTVTFTSGDVTTTLYEYQHYNVGYYDSTGTNPVNEMIQPGTYTVRVTTMGDTYGGYVFDLTYTITQQTGGGGGVAPDPEPEGPVVADPDDTGVSDWLITDEHIAYLSGYPGSLFMPNSDMTRAEAAQMFYNLLVNKNVPVTVGFADVPEDEWYAEAVNTLASLGILEGVGENRFEPQRAITRAEFTAIAMRFTNGVPSGENIFPDVSPDEWYYDYVVGAIQYGWIDGYPSGYFGPEDTITRAEVTTIVNRMLARSADEGYVDSHADRLVQFIDLTDAHWAYYQIMEAANGHTYTITDGEETWTGLH